MSFRVFHATGLVLGDGPSLRDGAVVVSDDGTVQDVGRASDVLPRHFGLPVIRVDGVIFPGLVNAHTHLELSALATSAPPGLGFSAWAKSMLGERMRISRETSLRATSDAVRELSRLGTVAVGDVGNGLSSAAFLAEHGIVGALFHEVFGSVRETAMSRVRAIEEEAREVAAFEQGLAWSPSPHTLHTTHPDAVRALLALARSRGTRSSLHLAEHGAEREALEHGRGAMVDFLEAMGVPKGAFAWPGKGPIAYADELGALAPDVLLVHLADANDHELERVARADAKVVVCPRSNMWIEGLVPRLGHMLAHGLRPALGTDSLASSPSLDVLEEARSLRECFPDVPTDVLLQMATWNGSEVLGISGMGRIVKGARPGLFAVCCDVSGHPSDALLDAWQAPRERLDRTRTKEVS
jgi:cytosine/adenosine deaminase-related metal-dependent hydrolase